VRAFNAVAGTEALLSLSTGAELLRARQPPYCALPIRTYSSLSTYVQRMSMAPALALQLARFLRRERIDVAVCAMPAAMDLVMAAALRLAGIPYSVVVHEADLHPGDRFASQLWLQRLLLRGADGAFALSRHVERRMRALGLAPGKTIVQSAHPPFHYGAGLLQPRADGPLRLLHFGRLIPYKGLDLLADSLALLGSRCDVQVRIVGSGPESPILDRLRRLPGVMVENRWIEEDDVAALIEWSDAFILSYREASQSGVAATAIAARRWIIATRVGGLPEQLADEPMALLCEPTAESLAAAIDRLCAIDRTALMPAGGADQAWQAASGAMIDGLRAIAAGTVRIRA
jgi:glycosyltransferase involved in cell wall biosynthesis